ncbi:hypothetical protein AB0A69_15665 [Streptomyces sp. NPDC045431]|uniref:hypothetical protein n=1 Tax=Streptomyces sp. NPDC045431 TaxID=3155613 RepID=UPI003404347E
MSTHPSTSTTPSLVELMARADERALAGSALACLDRCLPLLAPAPAAEVLRSLWAAVARGEDGWDHRLAEARQAVAEGGTPTDATGALVRTMLDDAPSAWARTPLHAWADACSRTALALHQDLEPASTGAPERYRAGVTDGAGPLVSGELRRQIRVLELLVTGGPGGLRLARDLSAEGQRVLRAVVSRRARTA